MSWHSADNLHEGYIEYIFADGFAGSGGRADGITVTIFPDGTPIPRADRPPPRPAAELAGWQAACRCKGRPDAWRGDLWLRGEATVVKDRVLGMADAHAGDIEDLPAGMLLRGQWNRHLGPAYSELADVRAAAAESKRARAQLDEKVAVARAAGASWEDIGESAGLSKQSAHQRWSPR
jgi:hypothetical protein